MEVSGEAADLVMKEGVQISEEAIKLLARGAKNLAALLYALAKDQKKLYGKDQVGIIANVCSQLAACNINILEISQKIMDGFFTMMLVTDLSGCKQPLDEVSELLKTCAEGKTLSIRIQREDMFDAMYKL